MKANVTNYQNRGDNNSFVLKARGVISRWELSQGHDHLVHFAPVSDLQEATAGATCTRGLYGTACVIISKPHHSLKLQQS